MAKDQEKKVNQWKEKKETVGDLINKIKAETA